MNSSEQIDALASALVKAQGEFGNVSRDLVVTVETTKGNYSYTYADLATVLDAIREPLCKHGLSVVQPARTLEGDVIVRTWLIHESGQLLDCGELRMTPQRPGPQAMGSCITYARRYGLTSALGIAQTDDDCNGAEPHAEKTAPSKSMQAAIALIDQCANYQDFKVAWTSLQKPLREEIAKRKPKQIQTWKERFKDDANHDQRPDDNGEADENRTEPVAASS